MIYSLFYLINSLAIGFCCIGLGYVIGNARGKRRTREELENQLPFLIYDRDS